MSRHHQIEQYSHQSTFSQQSKPWLKQHHHFRTHQSDLSKQEQSYDEVVKEFIIDEKKYLRDLHMITKVFKDRLTKNEIATTNEADAIFR